MADAETGAPKEVPVRNVVATKEQKERNAARMAEAERFGRHGLQHALMRKGCCVSGSGRDFPPAGENFEEVYTFLSKEVKIRTEEAAVSLALKDAKDLKASVLEDHLDCEQGICRRRFSGRISLPAYFPRGADAVSEHDPRIFEEETKRSFGGAAGTDSGLS